LSIKSQFNLVASFLFDSLVIWFVDAYNLSLLFSGLHLLKPMKMVVYVRGRSDDLYYLIPYREGPVEVFIRYVLCPSDVFVDVEANVGYYTLLAARRGVSRYLHRGRAPDSRHFESQFKVK
jgi:hypothetical protein